MGEKKLSIEKILDKIETFIFLNFIEKKMIPTKEGYDLPLSGKFLYWILDFPLIILEHTLWFYTKRLVCIIKGCDVVWSEPFNVPEGVYDLECRRCGAYSELNGYYESDYKIIEK
ncbi:hypothetical protein DRN69_04285 [Candidatus Pacearchaeota archaeon]|nr:MAG: hypothetical protein DRN69_04285 [Candidatus Pacearchaeota archaeon]